ncbi:hypothetical protein BJY00DRAFT_306870 [Aspergillus carlsbadensis]|nr:hypothetical protein BJY00DRAFT_306870 [Aspergillus carlsbadensis]
MPSKSLHTRWKSVSGPLPVRSSHVPIGGKTGITPIGSGKEHLVLELEKLYWEGVRHELENILYTLKTWQKDEFAHVGLPEDGPESIHGYDTFLDQVNGQARAFAIRYQEERNRTGGNPAPRNVSEQQAIQDALTDTIAERSAAKMKAEVRQNVASVTKLSGIEEIARLLLQTAGFLDIDMMVTNRTGDKPDKSAKRPGIPQLIAKSISKSVEIDVFKCAKCHTPITGSMFTRGKDKFASTTICEPCYYAHCYGDSVYVKLYKHSIIEDVIDLTGKNKLCKCNTSIQSSVKIKGQPHVDIGSCPVTSVRYYITHKKYDGLRESAGLLPARRNTSSLRRAVSKFKNQPMVGQVAKTYLPDSTAAKIAMDTDVPLLFRECVEEAPFDHLDVALRVGTVMIENGQTSGVTITLRNPPVYHERMQITSQQTALRVDPDEKMSLWRWKQAPPPPRFYKLAMKQVVGAPFSGLFSPDTEQGKLELEVVKLLVSALQMPSFSGAPAVDPKETLDVVLAPVLDKLKVFLAERLKVYVASIAGRLADSTTELKWTPRKNNGFQFCSSLVDEAVFGPLVCGPGSSNSPTSPLYLVSFRCPLLQEYPDQKVLSKFDVPRGLVEEYVQKLFFGRFNDADVIDSLQEYWHDWGSFSGGPLYMYHNVFPWDCSEAWKRCPTQCGKCNIAKHVWAFPFDTWSMITLHLQRGQSLYAPPFTSSANYGKEQVSSLDWVKSRYSILAASSALNQVAAAMAQSQTFRKMTTWLHTDSQLLKANPALARVKLGGIHRAQPFSHSLEPADRAHYFLAGSATLTREEQIVEYENARNTRMRVADIPWVVARADKYNRFLKQQDWSDRDGFGGFGADSPRDDYYHRRAASTNYYPYFFPVTDTNSTGPGFQCTDAQLTECDRQAGDGDPNFGGENTCGSGCGSTTQAAATTASSSFGTGGYGTCGSGCGGCGEGGSGGGSGGGGSGGGGSGGGGSGGGGSGGGGSGGG